MTNYHRCMQTRVLLADLDQAHGGVQQFVAVTITEYILMTDRIYAPGANVLSVLSVQKTKSTETIIREMETKETTYAQEAKSYLKKQSVNILSTIC